MALGVLSARTGRLVTVALLCGGLALALGSWDSSAGAGHPRCKPKGTRTIMATERIRVYMYIGRGPVGRNVVLACHLRRGEEVWLGKRYMDAYGQEEADVGQIRIVGDMVGYEIYVRERGDNRRIVLVRNLRTEKPIWDLPSGKLPEQFKSDDGAGRVTDLEISRKGDVAFIVRPTYLGAPDVHEVYKADDPARGLELLDSAADVEPRSLAYNGGRIYWMKAGQPRSATLR